MWGDAPAWDASEAWGQTVLGIPRPCLGGEAVLRDPILKTLPRGLLYSETPQAGRGGIVSGVESPPLEA